MDWEFSAFDLDGKLLARNRSRSNPAQSIRFRQNLGEPDWAPYSVLMDSAYYNYCREITGRLGLIRRQRSPSRSSGDLPAAHRRLS